LSEASFESAGNRCNHGADPIRAEPLLGDLNTKRKRMFKKIEIKSQAT